jgi:hypothetical protein
MIFISSPAALDLMGDLFRTDYAGSVFFEGGLNLIHMVIPTLILVAGMSLLFESGKANLVLLRKTDQNDKPYGATLTFYNNLMYFSYLWIIIMLRHSIFERFSYFTYVFVILYIPELVEFINERVKSYLNNSFKKVIKSEEHDERKIEKLKAEYLGRLDMIYFAVISGIVLVTVAYNIYGLSAYVGGTHGVYPYTTWLSR